MNLSLEYKKIKRTGTLPAFLTGSIFAAIVPIVNTAVRPERFIHIPGSPVSVLFHENWQMMNMVNLLLAVAGACFFYHTEYADRAMQKMKTLPVRESGIFFGKFFLMALIYIFILAVEAASIAFCSIYWFQTGTDSLSAFHAEALCTELLQYFGCSFCLLLPCIALSLLISSVCQNMWISLGTGVICIFTATILPANHLILSLFPFAMPFQILVGTQSTNIQYYMYASFIELLMISLTKIICIKTGGLS